MRPVHHCSIAKPGLHRRKPEVTWNSMRLALCCSHCTGCLQSAIFQEAIILEVIDSLQLLLLGSGLQSRAAS